jgi:hypothetical protein
MRHYVNFTLLLAFASLVASGLLRFFQPFSLATTRIHIVFGTTVLILVGLHLASRLDYFAKMLRAPKKVGVDHSAARRLILLPLLICTYGWTACLLDWWPVPHLLSLGYEAKNRAIIFRAEDGTAVRRLENQSLQVKRQTSDESSLMVEIEWGPAMDTGARFPTPFSAARPQIAIWAESTTGALIETFFVSEESAYAEGFEWAGEDRRRVDLLPIWRHQFTLASGVEPDGQIDTYSSSTPEHSFSVENYLKEDASGFYVCVEVNAPNDHNAFFNADQPATAGGYTYPGIGQPSVYFSALIDPENPTKYYLMNYVGHGGSHSQQAGNVHFDSSQITTARDLIEKVLVRIKRP